MKTRKSRFKVKITEGDAVIKEMKDSYKPDTEYVTFPEYLRLNMQAFLEFSGDVREIYELLKMREIFDGSFSWFLRLFAKEKNNYLRENHMQIVKKTIGNDCSSSMQKNSEERISPNIELEDLGNGVIEKYKLPRRANLEVPIDEIQEALDAGAMIDDEFGMNYGIIFAPGSRDSRRFQKWLPEAFCKRHELEYREKGNMVVATKTDVLELLSQLDIPKLNKEG